MGPESLGIHQDPSLCLCCWFMEHTLEGPVLDHSQKSIQFNIQLMSTLSLPNTVLGMAFPSGITKGLEYYLESLVQFTGWHKIVLPNLPIV